MTTEPDESPADGPREVLLFPDGSIAEASSECSCAPHYGAHEPHCGLELIGRLADPDHNCGASVLAAWQSLKPPWRGTPVLSD